MNETYELRGGETHIEVHKFYPGAILVVAAIALVSAGDGAGLFPWISRYWICRY